MPRKRTQSVKESTAYRYCRYCKANRDNRRFDKHQTACKLIWQQAQQQLRLSAERINEQTEREKVDNSLIKVNFRFPTYTTVVTRNILKDGPSTVDGDGDTWIPDSFEEEVATAAYKTAEECNCPFITYQFYLLMCNN